MADILQSKSVSIQTLIDNLDRYKYNPSTVQRVILEHLDEITQGEVDIVDPTSPFVFLLESSAVSTAVAITENVVNLRKQYPSLSQTEDELYLHLSDKDFLDRFATPVETKFTVMMQLADILNKMVYSPLEGCHKATFPRDTKFKVDDYTFTIQYPIDIRKYENGVVQVSYDGNVDSPIDTLSGNIIDYRVRKDDNNVSWLFFQVKAKQYFIESVEFPLQKSIKFSQTITHNDQFYYIRAFYKNDGTNSKWVEFKTTHTDQVFDSFKPTACVQVHDGFVKVSIPPIYLNTNMISGKVRFDVYCTKGNLSVNLSNYKVESFSLDPYAVDEIADLNEYTNALSVISYYSYSSELISGGTNGITFEELRERVIYNSLGKEQIPITNVKIDAHVQAKGFQLVKNVDTVTNRVFLATQRLPKPLNNKLATSANIGIGTLIADTTYLKTLSSVKDNGARLTLLSKNLFKVTNGVTSIVKPSDIATLKALPKSLLISEVNSTQYLYNPFHYVLDDTNSEFELRAYNLDYPLASDLSFVSQNQSIQLPVNTGKYTLTKITNGYKLTIVTKSGTFYRGLGDSEVFAQLAYYPVNEINLAYINGTLVDKTDDDERIYEFLIETNYDIDSSNSICITNAKMFSDVTVKTWCKLDSQFHIFYATTSLVDGYVKDEADDLLGKFLLPPTASATTHETLQIALGTTLKTLWTRSRSMASGLDYLRHQQDIPMFYMNDVYQNDPQTGSIFSVDVNGELVYTLLHTANDPVLDNLGNQVYKHRKGDVVLDENNNPVLANTVSVKKEVDLLFVDGRHYFVTDAAFVSYNDELVAVLDNWITETVAEIQTVLLEQTRIFFYPKTTLGATLIYSEDKVQDHISSEQSIVVDLYVKGEIYGNNEVRQRLIDSSVKVLDEELDNSVINTGVIVSKLKTAYGNSVENVDVKGIGGSKNYRVVTLADEENRLTLKKILAIQQDGSLIIKEDVVVNFYKVS
jgi:hypothetical protein